MPPTKLDYLLILIFMMLSIWGVIQLVLWLKANAG